PGKGGGEGSAVEEEGGGGGGAVVEEEGCYFMLLINPLSLYADVAEYTRRNTYKTSPLGGLYGWRRYASVLSMAYRQ
ncbi:hypothetical protein Tco_0897710, partial [Tanacetum coccineum]